jgi:hypothetical protein
MGGNRPPSGVHKRGYDSSSYVKIVGIEKDVLESMTTDNSSDIEKLVDTNDQGNGVINRVVIPFDGFKYITTHVRISANSANDTVTMTLWGTNDERADNLSDTYWVDITEDEWLTSSVVVNNSTYEHIFIIDLPLVMDSLMIKLEYAYSGGIAADNSVEIFVKKSS